MSKSSNHIEKLHSIQTVENFNLRVYWSFFAALNNLQFFQSFVNQQCFVAMNSHHFEQVENKMRINATT